MSFRPPGQWNRPKWHSNTQGVSFNHPHQPFSRHQSPSYPIAPNASPYPPYSSAPNSGNGQNYPPNNIHQPLGAPGGQQANFQIFPPSGSHSAVLSTYPSHTYNESQRPNFNASFSRPPPPIPQSFGHMKQPVNGSNAGINNQGMPILPEGVNFRNPPPPIRAMPSFNSQPHQPSQVHSTQFPPPRVGPPHPVQTDAPGTKFDKSVAGQSPVLEQWLKSVRKSKKPTGKRKKTSSKRPVQIWRIIQDLQEMNKLITKLSDHLGQMSSLSSSADDTTWLDSKSTCDKMKDTILAASENCFETGRLQEARGQLSKIKTKRGRLKRLRAAKFEEDELVQQEWNKKSKEIDKWQERLRSQIHEENKEKKRKLAADRTLSKVTREIHDATRLIDTMFGLQKLRLIRRDAAQKRGDSDIGESRQQFEEKINDMTRLVKAQLECYKEEELKLKEILKSEEEEKNKLEQKNIEDKVKQQHAEEYCKLRSLVFGPNDTITPDDPIYPFNQYYRQAEQHLSTFLQIRQEWDSFLVPKGTPASSCIPTSWVMPAEPSSSKWAAALQ